MPTFINTVSLRHVSNFKGSSSGIAIDAFQQQGQHNELPHIKFNASN